MFNKIGANLALLATVLMSYSSIASANQLSLGRASYGGNGCPAGSASVSVSPDQRAVSILFDEYIVEAGKASRKTIDRKSCNISIPVHVPNGYSVSIIQVDYRGFVHVPRNAQAQFNVEYFFAGSRGPRITENFGERNRRVSRDYLITDRLAAHAYVWSPCGASTNLRINSSMMARTNPNRADTLATVDSVDVSSGLIYHLEWRRCW